MKQVIMVIFLGIAITFGMRMLANAQAKSLRGFMQIGPSPQNAVQYGNNPKAGRYVVSTDAKIYYEVYGKGEPIVVLHGGVFGSSYEMGQLIDSLSKSFKVIAISTRGHGRSESGRVEPSYRQKAMDVAQIINVEAKESVSVLGFSDGAYTGIHLAVAYPSKVKKVIAIGAGEWKKGSRSFELNRQMAFELDSLYWEQQLSLMPQPSNLDSWFSSLNSYYNSVAVGREIFGEIKCPVLLMAGELDQNAPLQTVLDAYKMIPKAQLSIIPNAPHPAFLVNFNAVWSALLPFITTNTK